MAKTCARHDYYQMDGIPRSFRVILINFLCFVIYDDEYVYQSCDSHSNFPK